MKYRATTGSLTLAVLALKRDRIRLVAWVLGIALLTAAMVAAFTKMLPAEEDVVNMLIAHATNPVTRIFLGAVAGVNIGGFVMFRVSTVLAVAIAFFGMLTVTRHTRQNEENSCEELTGSTVVGRHASLLAAVLVTTAATIALAILIALAFIVNGQPAAGSFAAGAALGAVGIAFAGIAAITAQLTDTTRSANGIAGLVMAVAFLVSGLGNMLGEFNESSMELSSAWPVWLSPFGWYQQILAFHDNNWWILLLFVIFFVLTLALAFVLNKRRDVGMGIIPARKGPATAAPALLSPLGLAWKLQHKLFLLWAGAAFLFGGVLGSAVGELSEQMGELERADQIFGEIFGMSETFSMAIAGLLGSFIVFYTVQAFTRMISEEASGLTEPVLAAAVSPLRWILSHYVLILSGTLTVLLFLGLGGAASALVEDGIRWHKVVQSALLQAPAILVLAGFSIMAFGLIPRWSGSLAWTALVISLLTGPFLGPALDLPLWAQKISPFTHLPSTTETITAGPIISLSLIAMLLTAIGLISFSRRSMRT